MHDPVQAHHQPVPPMDFTTTLFASKQGTYPTEGSFLDWIKRFKQNLHLTNPYIGNSALGHYVKTLPAYVAAAYKPSAKEQTASEPVSAKF